MSVSDLLKAMVRAGLITQDDALSAYGQISKSKTRQDHPILLVAGCKIRSQGGSVLDVEAVSRWVASAAGLEYLHIDPLTIEFSRVTEAFTSSYASKHSILPIEVGPKEIVVATDEPVFCEWMSELSGALRKPIRRVFTNPPDLRRYIAEFYSLANSVGKAFGKSSVQGGPRQNNFEQLVQMGAVGLANRRTPIDQNDQGVVQIVDWLWQYAFEQRASDIHLEPKRDHGIVRFRIDGVLHQVYQVPTPVMAAMCSRVKLLGRMDVVERRRPQDGRVKTKTPDGKEVELRLSTLPTAFGEKLVMRIFDPDVVVLDFHRLGFSADDEARWRDMIARPNGIVLVTGPTGSGKTTTLYSTLKTLATPEVNVCTVEDPIEMVEPAFNQMQVQQGIDLSFSDGLRALMRQDPDVIMVGEIRDIETADMAIQAALTGHLVISTLHTNDAPSAVSRMLELGVAPYLISAAVVGVMGQRLVRTLCRNCRAEDGLVTDDVWLSMVGPERIDKVPKPARVYRPVGCLECRMTGYRGRVGIYETFVMNDSIRGLVNRAPSMETIRKAIWEQGMLPLRVDGARKVIDGITTVEEVIKATPIASEHRENQDIGNS
jgi:general secretion pathway protein E